MATDLVARLNRLEAELRVLDRELAQLRTLVAVEQMRADAAPAREAAPASAPPVPAPATPRAEPSLPKPAAPPPPTPTPVPAPPPSVPAPPAVAAKPARAPSKEWAPKKPAAPAKPPRPPRRSARELAEDWDLTGPRGFAIVGGAVLALGIGFFFVLAANRGWIDERARIALGAAASLLAIGAGLWLRARYGQYWAALGAVGAGIAGAYATLAAATARYDIVPDALGLPVAAVIAAIGTAIAIRWHSEVIAALGLLGAALAPALQAIDTGMAWESVAFALIVLVATGVVAIPRRWDILLHVTSAVVVVQGLWLASEAAPPAGAGTVLVIAALAATLLGIAVGLQLVSERGDLDPLSLTYALVALGIPLTTTSELFAERTDRGLALVGVASVWIVPLAVLAWRRKPDLAFVVALSGLALTAVGTALLLTDAALVVAWSVEAVVLAVLASRFADARLHLTALAYAALASLYALGGVGRPSFLFDSAADHRAGVLPLAVSAIAFVAAGVVARTSYGPRAETGLLAFVAFLRKGLETHRQGVRETCLFVGAALATLSASFALVSLDYEWGHIAASVLAATVGAVILGVAGRLHTDGLAAASYLWLGVVLVVAVGFDAPEFWESATDTSSGGWSLLAVAAGLLGGAYAHRVQSPDERARDLVAGACFVVAAATAAVGVGLVTEGRTAAGLGLLVVTAAFAALAGSVFRRDGLRNVSTTLWSLGLVVLILAEAVLVTDSAWRAVAIAVTGAGVAATAGRLHEERLWLAGGSQAAATTVVTLLVARPWLEGSELTGHFAIATGGCVVAALAVAGLRWREERWRDLVTVLWALGILAVLATERLVVSDVSWLVAVVAATAVVVGALASPLREERLWLAGSSLALVTTAAALLEHARPWLERPDPPRQLAIATAACALAGLALAALRWGDGYWRDAVTVLWGTGIVAVLATERILLGDVRATAIAFALTGGALALGARPLREPRIWTAGAALVGGTLVTTLLVWTPPSHLLVASGAPADGLWVLLACLVGLGAVAATAQDATVKVVLEAVAGGIALYALSLGILEVAERVSTATVETDFERGHTAVSGLWALVGLALLVAGLLRGSTALRYAGLALFGLSLAKIFLYDLSSLSSVARAFSFILVGGLLLAGGFFLQRLSDRLGPPRHP